MVLCMSVFGLAVCAAAFGAATRPNRASLPESISATVDERLASFPDQFFVHADAPVGARPAGAGGKVPLPVLLLQLERHIRLEQAAAESFVFAPSLESLHGSTAASAGH